MSVDFKLKLLIFSSINLISLTPSFPIIDSDTSSSISCIVFACKNEARMLYDSWLMLRLNNYCFSFSESLLPLLSSKIRTFSAWDSTSISSIIPLRIFRLFKHICIFGNCNLLKTSSYNCISSISQSKESVPITSASHW